MNKLQALKTVREERILRKYTKKKRERDVFDKRESFARGLKTMFEKGTKHDRSNQYFFQRGMILTWGFPKKIHKVTKETIKNAPNEFQ